VHHYRQHFTASVIIIQRRFVLAAQLSAHGKLIRSDERFSQGFPET
jgi:hypothetical protein